MNERHTGTARMRKRKSTQVSRREWCDSFWLPRFRTRAFGATS